MTLAEGPGGLAATNPAAPRSKTSYERAKRALDVLVASSAIVLLSPVLLIVSMLVRSRLGRPILFVQERPGKGERPFRMYKFRTMRDARDAEGVSLPDRARLTRFGRWLRSTSLDELPELVNVVRGDMSLVGPRPLLMEYLPRYDARQRRRHDVRPGVTGWAQVRGRNAVGWSERFEMDVWYVENRSMKLDLRILLLTVIKVFRREGIRSPGAATMEPFMGNEDDQLAAGQR